MAIIAYGEERDLGSTLSEAEQVTLNAALARSVRAVGVREGSLLVRVIDAKAVPDNFSAELLARLNSLDTICKKFENVVYY